MDSGALADRDWASQDAVMGQQHGLQLRYLKQQVLGFVLYADERISKHLQQKALSVIRDDLQEIVRVLPDAIVARLYEYPICFWLNLDNGASKKGCCCHCIDLPDEYMACKSHSVEIFDVQDFLEQRHAQPAQLLHEISHWVHHDKIYQERGDQFDEWRQSLGKLHATEQSIQFQIEGLDVGILAYEMSGFRNASLNGRFVLDEASLIGASSYRDLVLVKLPNLPTAKATVICRCTDLWSTPKPDCQDRWHLEVDGQVLAYRTSTDFGRKVVAWQEWVSGSWNPSGARASSPSGQSSLLVEGFGELELNGRYIEEGLTLESWYSARLCSNMMKTAYKAWIKESDVQHGPDIVLRFTNMHSEAPETARVPFDRWHIERGGDCRAYNCHVDPLQGSWNEVYISPTDQVILTAYSASLPLYSNSSERIGCYAPEPHYAATNHKEFFAECSEAYFSTVRFRNDYFPYIHSELKGYDPIAYAMCEAVWGPRNEDGIEARYLDELWPHCIAEGSASSLVTSPDNQRRFLQRVFEAARDRAQSLSNVK